MCNNIVLQKRSALSDTVKVSSLTEEIVRRLKCSGATLSLSSRMDTLEYISQRFVKRIVASGICKYERKLEISKLEEAHPLHKPLHQPSRRSVRRLRKKTMARENWFKQNEEKPDQPGNKSFQKAGKQSTDQKSSKKINASTVKFIPNTKHIHVQGKVKAALLGGHQTMPRRATTTKS